MANEILVSAARLSQTSLSENEASPLVDIELIRLILHVQSHDKIIVGNAPGDSTPSQSVTAVDNCRTTVRECDNRQTCM
jgi:hypothetical protein